MGEVYSTVTAAKLKYPMKIISYSESCDIIKADFADNKIPVENPGFYNYPNFIAIEKQNADYLNNYARYVQCREFTAEYLNESERKIKIIVEQLYEEIRSDGRLGACIDASGILAQILEKENVWCYQVKGSLTINFPILSRLKNEYFFSIDIPSGGQVRLAAHSWVVAPPFNVIDLTIKQQTYIQSKATNYLPNYVLEKEIQPAQIYTSEICSPEAIIRYGELGFSQSNLHFQVKPHLKEFFKVFPSNLIKFEKTRLKYIPAAITAMDGTIEQNETFKPNGKSAIELYETTKQLSKSFVRFCSESSLERVSFERSAAEKQTKV